MLQFIIGFILGAISSFFLYACIIVGKESDKDLERLEGKDVWRKQD